MLFINYLSVFSSTSLNGLAEYKVMIFWDVSGNGIEENYKSLDKVPKPSICISNTFHLLRNKLRFNPKNFP